MQHRASLTQMCPTPLTEIPNELVVFLVRSTCLSNASCSTSSSTSSLPASRTRCEMTFCVEHLAITNRHEHGFRVGKVQLVGDAHQCFRSSSVVIGRLRLRRASARHGLPRRLRYGVPC